HVHDLFLYNPVFCSADWLFDHHWRRSFCVMENHPAPAFHTATDCGRAGHGMVEIRPGDGLPARRREPHGTVVVSAAVPDWNECFLLGHSRGVDGQDFIFRPYVPHCSRHLLAEPTGVAQTMASAATGIGST